MGKGEVGRARILAGALIGVGIAGVASPGCDDRTERSPDPGVTELIDEICTLMMRCCDRGEVNLLAGPYVDPEDCSSRLIHASAVTSASFELQGLGGPTISLPNLGALRGALQDGRIDVDDEALDACVAYLAELECPQPATVDPDPDPVEGCVPPEPSPISPCDPANLFVGRVGHGGECTSSLFGRECAPGLTCGRDPALGVEGLCVWLGGIGSPCFSDIECGLVKHEGELEPGMNRREQLYCSQADGTCQLYRNRGEPCFFADGEAPSTDTLLVECAPGLTCDPITDSCAGPCELGSACVDDSQCDATRDLFCVQSRCDTLRPEDAPCSAADDCAPPLTCALQPGLGRVCAPKVALGLPCISHDECDTAFCDPTTDRCAEQVEVGDLCPSRDSAQCEMGTCTSEFVFCETDDECPGSGSCDLTLNFCAYYCASLKPDGATCTTDGECSSQECVASFCRTTPLDDGVACDSEFDCASAYCSLDEMRVCKSLPLDLGEPCLQADHCESEVCFQETGALIPTCVVGLAEGEACGDPEQPPCSPLTVYCDTENPVPICTPLRGTGEECESSEQCRGSCLVQFSRRMCFPPPDPGAPFCDGSNPVLGGSDQ